MERNGKMLNSEEYGDRDVQSNEEEEGKIEKGKSTHGVMGVVFVALVIDLLAFTMILPLLPALLDYYGQNDKGGLYFYLKDSVRVFRELVGAPDTPRWNGVLFGGLIGSLFSLLQYLASPVIGALSDSYGRRPLMLVTMVGVALSYAIWAVSRNFTIFVIARIVGGISKGNVSLSTAIVADVYPVEKRGKGMALVGIAFSIGFIIGPMIGAVFSSKLRDQGDMFFVTPALFALTLASLDIIFLYLCFQETLPQHKRASSVESGLFRAVSLIHPKHLFRFSAVQNTSETDLQSIRQIGWVYFLYLFIYSGLEFTLTFLTHLRFSFDSMQQGKMFLFIGAIMVLLQGGYVRRLKQGTEQKLAIRGVAALLPAFITIGLASQVIVMYLGLILFAFASASVVPCLTTLAASHGSAEQKGTVLGIFRSLGALARALGPIVASTVYWCLGAAPCYLIGSVSLLLPLILLTRVKLESKTV